MMKVIDDQIIIKEFETLTPLFNFKSKSEKIEICFDIYCSHQSFINMFTIY